MFIKAYLIYNQTSSVYNLGNLLYMLFFRITYNQKRTPYVVLKIQNLAFMIIWVAKKYCYQNTLLLTLTNIKGCLSMTYYAIMKFIYKNL